MRLLLQAAIVLSLLVTSASAQDPLKVAPQAYQLEFENEWVRVIRVHYGPRVKIPVHDHTEWAAAYVYLNDSAQIIFKHIGPESSAITRPPTKAGSFRLYKAVSEVHEVENPTDIPSSFLRIEFKTEPLGDATLRGRYYREAYPARENYKKVQFENEQVRATRIICAPGQTLTLTDNLSAPALFIALTPVHLRALDQKNTTSRLDLETGKTKWFGSNQPARLENPGNEPAEFIRFELKTKPTSNAGSHEHEARKIRVVATDDFEFSPKFITVKKGVPVELELVSQDKYRKHGFKLAQFGIRADMNAEGITRVRFVPDKVGTFAFICDVFCGDGHNDMHGTLVVTE